MTLVQMLAWFGLGAAMILVEATGARRFGSLTTPEARRTDELMIMATIVCIGGGLAGALVVPNASLEPSWLWIGAGALVGCAGLVLRATAMHSLGRHYTLSPGIESNHVLVTGGPYRMVRHPGYTGTVLQLLGMAMIVCSFVSVAFVLVVLAALPVRIRFEERMLSEHFGAEYGSYVRRTRFRLIPWII